MASHDGDSPYQRWPRRTEPYGAVLPVPTDLKSAGGNWWVEARIFGAFLTGPGCPKIFGGWRSFFRQGHLKLRLLFLLVILLTIEVRTR